MIIWNAYLANRELEGICFDSSDLRGSDFTGADLYGANLSDGNFDSCVFVGADLRWAYMYRASFRNADMRDVRFSLSELASPLDLSSVDFSNANLDGADFTGAIYDSETVFPDGFDPAARGLTVKVRG
jgi:uncharacterized protein YjbI with pentapeptide repeats